MTPAPDILRVKYKNLQNKYIKTPKIIWNKLSKEFNFTVDLCASDKNHLLPKYYTKENNALLQNWDNEIGYCHPIFDVNIPKFIAKAFKHNCTVVFLLPSSTNSKYFHNYLWDNKNHKVKKNVEIRFLQMTNRKNGYKFLTDDNKEPEFGYLKPLMIVIINNLNK
jgi:site-specific DNA-methyltransferase (adenine-specific)